MYIYIHIYIYYLFILYTHILYAIYMYLYPDLGPGRLNQRGLGCRWRHPFGSVDLGDQVGCAIVPFKRLKEVPLNHRKTIGKPQNGWFIRENPI